ncbi:MULTISPECIES: hypothetical protein [Kitasatospora]|uniref:Uncharacterized protein n=1 Tax=Kitasatospora setae (strain ATCC 33774 / DSM 43861 / JCM 3304 / KCC A-0304 / NBRC 14216 / KM-6054) TaxID=452652 RepID=E4MZ47_KITSK|nr:MULTISPECIES: hypothetical protein [Kitasatospora]BAJ29621.1 hypothetical protein KSE_38240 [Kitasatospora setae KM-6054]
MAERAAFRRVLDGAFGRVIIFDGEAATVPAAPAAPDAAFPEDPAVVDQLAAVTPPDADTPGGPARDGVRHG